MKRLWRLLKTIGSSLVTLAILGLSLLPLSALLLVLPAGAPQESVLSDTVGRRRFRRQLLARLFALLTGVTVLLTQLAVSVELTSRLPLPARGAYASIARGFLPPPIDFGPPRTAEQKEEEL